jgi:hypothetical protein
MQLWMLMMPYESLVSLQLLCNVCVRCVYGDEWICQGVVVRNALKVEGGVM